MGRWEFLAALLAAGVGVAQSAPANSASEQIGARVRVLYVGNAETDRGRAYARFLGESFTLVKAVDRKTFDPNSAEAKAAEVVVLDWSQMDIEHPAVRDPGGYEAHLKSPLGRRDQWSKPTVLLGSAGHLLAAPWRVFGGSG